ncbi:MAG: GspH/FimT family pseudopilin [Steroidobacteraceae bacterium]
MRERARGFTLLELMTAIAVLAVLAGLGVPAFTNIVRNNQIAAESGNLVTALTLARSEALKRGVRVSVCGAAGADACAEDADWSDGWLVFTDDFGDIGVIDDQDEVVQVWPAPLSGVAVNTVDASVTFTRNARAEFAATFNVLKDGCSGEQQRVISVGASGRVNLTRIACPED